MTDPPVAPLASRTVAAYANGDINRAFLVEVKSHPRDEAITQLKTTLSRFRDFSPGMAINSPTAF